jgi:RNA polymerase sigma factor (sigma-70 family)
VIGGCLAVSPTLVSNRSQARAAEPAAESAGDLYERYYDRIYGYCLYQLGSREEAEDVAQTTFMWAFRGLRRGIVPRAEASWLFTIAQNACRARHRTRGRRREREVLSDPMLLADMSPAREVESDDLMGLEEALARMPELQRRAILLREWRGFSYKEIAEELELSGAAVETLIFRARRSLAELLAGKPAPKRSRALAFDFGSIAAALKSFLGAGSAAKVAAGVAAIVAATTLAGATEQTATKTDAPVTPAVRARVVHSQPQASNAVASHSNKAPAKSATAVKNPPTSAPIPSQPGGTVGSAVDQGTGSLPVVPEVVGTLPVDTATVVVDVLDSATGVLAPITNTLP